MASNMMATEFMFPKNHLVIKSLLNHVIPCRRLVQPVAVIGIDRHDMRVFSDCLVHCGTSAFSSSGKQKITSYHRRNPNINLCQIS